MPVKAVEAIVPTAATLKKYGLTEDEWRNILRAQGGVCGVCGTLPSTGRLHIDHRHVPGFKKMTPEERKVHVRGLVCMFDNRFILARNTSAKRLRGAADYLDRANGLFGEGRLP